MSTCVKRGEQYVLILSEAEAQAACLALKAGEFLATQLIQQLDRDLVEPQGEPESPDPCHVVVHDTNGGEAGWVRCETHNLHIAFCFTRAALDGYRTMQTCPAGRA